MKYTIDQIRDYVTGWILNPETEYNGGLYNILNNLEDEEDGIQAMVDRQREMHVSELCIMRFASAQYLTEELPLELCRPDTTTDAVLYFISQHACDAFNGADPGDILEDIYCDAKQLERFITNHGGHVHEA